MKIIDSPNGFLRWATREKGPKWFEDSQILYYYGKEQLMQLYPQFFPEQLENQIQNVITQDLSLKTNLSESENIIKYPTPFDDYFETSIIKQEPYTEVQNIFNLDSHFDASKVMLNTDRLLYEVYGIYDNVNTRKGRSFQEVLDCTIMGHKLEQYLINTSYFIDDTRKYMDIISQDGYAVDCKVVSKFHSGTVKFLAEKIINKTFAQKPNYIVIYENQNGIYEYKATVQIF